MKPNTPTILRVLCDAHDAIDRATDSDQLRIEMQKFAVGMGFEHFAYVLTINSPSLKPQRYIVNGFPAEWMQRYVSHNYFKVDPIIEQAEKSTLPMLWNDDQFFDGKAGEFWEEARNNGLRAGLTFTVRDQPGITGIFSLARDRIFDLQGQGLAAVIGRAQMFAGLLHQAVSRIALPALVPEHGATLTPRELECVKWSADGKTAWEIGRILGISERTAVFHMNNVIKKLGAINKTQAIVRAVVLKLVS